MSPSFKPQRILGLSALAVITTAASITTYNNLNNPRKRQITSTSSSEKQQPAGIQNSQTKMAVTTPFQTLFAVPMHCEGCAKDISGALHKLPGITKVEPNVKEQLVTIEGTAPPSAIVEAIQSTGRDAILRGSGTSNSAAVSILETYHHLSSSSSSSSSSQPQSSPSDLPIPSGPGSWVNPRLVRGLARFVQVSPTSTLIDLTIRGVPAGRYRASIRQYGNLSAGAASTGPVWSGKRGDLGLIEVGPDGRGSAFINHEFQVWEVIGHALCVSSTVEEGEGEGKEGQRLKNDEGTVVGIIARSAGVWDNDKTVCSCTGKTLWEERKDEVGKGML